MSALARYNARANLCIDRSLFHTGRPLTERKDRVYKVFKGGYRIRNVRRQWMLATLSSAPVFVPVWRSLREIRTVMSMSRVRREHANPLTCETLATGDPLWRSLAKEGIAYIYIQVRVALTSLIIPPIPFSHSTLPSGISAVPTETRPHLQDSRYPQCHMTTPMKLGKVTATATKPGLQMPKAVGQHKEAITASEV